MRESDRKYEKNAHAWSRLLVVVFIKSWWHAGGMYRPVDCMGGGSFPPGSLDPIYCDLHMHAQCSMMLYIIVSAQCICQWWISTSIAKKPWQSSISDFLEMYFSEFNFCCYSCCFTAMQKHCIWRYYALVTRYDKKGGLPQKMNVEELTSLIFYCARREDSE